MDYDIAECLFLQALNILENRLAESVRANLKDHNQAVPSPGVYVLYLQGRVIYVGKAKWLSRRLGEHYRKVSSATIGLAASDVTYATIQCDERLALAFEDHLIKLYRPEWNTTGFGNHSPGRRRSTQAPAAWDVLYGRAA